MEPAFNLWIEVGGKVAFSVWRAELLKTVAESGSISTAARRMHVPYRTAWLKIHEMEKRLGAKLVSTRAGGRQGGGTRLTQTGQEYVTKMERFHTELASLVTTKYEEIFEG